MTTRTFALYTVCLVVLGCASADELSKRSHAELGAGHAQKAYDQAKKALKKDASNADAHVALYNAGSTLTVQSRERVMALAAAGDTLAAGDESLRLEDLRREMAEFGAGTVDDSAYTRSAVRVRDASAAIHYRRGRDEMTAGRPKRAYDEYVATQRFASSYRDVEKRTHDAFEAAQTRVAILPFENQTGVRGLSMEMASKIHAEVGQRIDPKQFRFTTLLERDAVFDRVPVSALTRLERADALRIGNDLGAERVVVGVFHDLHSEKSSQDYVITTYRHRQLPLKNRKGSTKELPEWVEEPLHIRRSERNAWVTYDFAVLDAKSGEALLTRSATLPATAIVLWTDDAPDGSLDDYALWPPDYEKTQPDQVKRIKREWKQCAGGWKLRQFLERTRQREHTRYRSDEDRRSFFDFSSDKPVVLGELPPESDLAFVALDPMWNAVLAALRELDDR